MAVEYLGENPTSYIAGANISATTHYRFVKIDTTAGQVVLCGQGDTPIGVVQEGAAAGNAVSVLRPPARSKVTAAQTLTAGQRVATNAAGKAIPWVANYGTAGWTEAAGSTDGLVTVTLTCIGGTA